MTPVVPVLAGYLLDGLCGDPRWLPHPVRGLGWLITQGERRLNRGSPRRRQAAGALLVLAVAGLSLLTAWALPAAARTLHPLLGDAITALGVGLLLARRSLGQEAGHAVQVPLAAGDLTAARAAVAQVVGRDTAALDATGLARAAVETLAENTSDGVIAPLLFALVGGLPGIALYKSINTLDSMIGHRNERYTHFGWAAARLDDLANWLPARLTTLALVAAAGLAGKNSRAAWRTARGEARKHASPNAGWPEAAMAGALGVRLGGLNYYDREQHAGPIFNRFGRPPTGQDITAAVAMMHLGSHLTLAAGSFLALAVRWFLG